MNKKIIIKNESKHLDDLSVLCLVHEVVYKGRIFNNETEYNYITLFKDVNAVIKTTSNKLSDSFLVFDYKFKERVVDTINKENTKLYGEACSKCDMYEHYCRCNKDER
jgi:hypothetical protein